MLEINGFLRHSKNYEGLHDVVRWSTRSATGGGGPLKVLSQAQALSKEMEAYQPDLILCHAFGTNYGNRKGGGLTLVRHSVKARFEKHLMAIVKGLKEKTGARLGVVDIADDQTIHPVNVELLKIADLYFKRELPLDPYHFFESLRASPARAGTLFDRRRDDWNEWVGKLRPLTLGCASVEPGDEWVTQPEDKEWDVFYAGHNLYRPRRDQIREELEALVTEGYRIRVPEEPLSIKDYLKEMSASWLAVSPPGLGWDCHRHYEASLVGTVPVTPFPTIQRHAPLRNGEHCCFYDPEKELGAQIKEMLCDRKRLEEISQNAKNYSKHHHTFERLFDHVVVSTTTEN